jgi:hypothetical protein
MAAFASVFTHLRHEESFVYVMGAKRVLKPGGIIVFTFLEFSQADHWVIFQSRIDAARAGITNAPLDQFIDKGAIETWSRHLGLEVVQTYDGGNRYIRLSQDIVLADGTVLSGTMTIGQSAYVLRKPAAPG